MTPFELLEPRTLREAAGLLDSGETPVRPIAGGTAVMLIVWNALRYRFGAMQKGAILAHKRLFS